MHYKKISSFTQLFILCVLFVGTSQLTFGKKTDAESKLNPKKSLIKIILPSSGEKVYKIAGEAFSDLWEKVTGEKPIIYLMEPNSHEIPDGNIVLIGSDAVNPMVHGLISSGVIDGLGIQYGGDNYRILSVDNHGQTCLILAGGSGRSTIYAVYDFFRKQAGVEYFWDGDVIPKMEKIEITGLDVLEQPRFEYRGLRYFAHRGLHRFQAEHWDLDDWKKEIDWMLKKRFNLFMLRTGIDDLFQRAFPGDVPYPPADAQDPDAKQRSYDDRTSFWPLKYRGELRKQVLQYARDRGLLHPEDAGTITHWYSHTPSSFYKSFPDFPVVRDQKTGYSLTTHAIWDIESQTAWDTYWKLTQTHINEFGGGTPRLFHTIGMAERTFGENHRDNLQSKLYVYRKTQEMIRKHYPDAPLFIASWDLMGWNWENKEVQQLIREFDPKRTVLLDYTADMATKITYRDWDVYKKFPWIFGIFHSLEKNSDIHEDYNILTLRLKEAVADEKCIGMVIWSENSHVDTYLLEYLGFNSWNPENMEIDKATKHFCNSRYPTEIAPVMEQLWESFLPLSESLQFDWGSRENNRMLLFVEPQFRVLTSNFLTDLTPDVAHNWETEYQRIYLGLKKVPGVLKGLANLANGVYDNEMWRRDALDMARTTASRAYFAALAKGMSLIEAWKRGEAEAKDIHQTAELSRELLASLSEILALSDDFSMYASLQRLNKAGQLEGIPPTLNPHTEQTLKGNAENNYCRSHQYELVQYVYRPELDVYWEWVFNRIKSGDKSEWEKPAEFIEQEKIITDKFYNTPLKDMAPVIQRNSKNFKDILNRLEKLANEFL